MFFQRILLSAAVTLWGSIGSAADKHSGYDDAGPETRAMQDDDASNPGFLWVQQGEALWSERVGSAGAPWRSMRHCSIRCASVIGRPSAAS